MLALIILALFLIPLSSILPVRGEAVWYPSFLCFFSFLGLFAVYGLRKFNKYLALFCLITLASVVFMTRFSPRAIICFVSLVGSLYVAYQISLFNLKQRKVLLYSIIAYGIFHSLFLLVQICNKDPFFVPLVKQGAMDMVVGFCGSPDITGIVFSILTVFFIARLPLLAVFPFIGVLYSHSSFSFVALIMATLFYLFFANRKLFITALIVVILASTFFMVVFEKLSIWDFKTRLSAQRFAVESTLKGEIKIDESYIGQGYIEYYSGNKAYIHCSPWFGFGFGNFLRIFPYIKGNHFNYADEKFTHAHNDLIEVFFELGILGLLSAIAFILNLAYRFIKAVKNKELMIYASCLLCYFLNTMGHFASHIAVSGFIGIVFLGLFQGALNGNITSSGERA